VTEYKRTERLSSDLIHNSPVGIFIAQDRKFKLANPRFQELIGYTEDELLRDEPLNIVYSEDRNKVRESAISMLKGKRFSPYEYRYFHKNGELRWVTEQVSSIQYQGKRAVLGSFMDITERKHAEEELRQTLKRLQKTIEGTISAVVAIVEARDPYTAGHQQRVAKLACAIAQEIRLPKKRVEAIRMAALIHDVGKIHIPAEILSKPGRLTETEFSLVKAHPQVAYDILKTVEFPWPVCQDVLQHHERLDGSGYPQGLSGKDILLGARILAVADVVEAMSSHRPYRPSLGIDKALEEIAQNKDILYDSKVVDACLRLFHEKGFKFE
jgi:PAS domain S-box-containing protein/putative nucleotidyltransferase with HDIG domain